MLSKYELCILQTAKYSIKNSVFDWATINYGLIFHRPYCAELIEKDFMQSPRYYCITRFATA